MNSLILLSILCLFVFYTNLVDGVQSTEAPDSTTTTISPSTELSLARLKEAEVIKCYQCNSAVKGEEDCEGNATHPIPQKYLKTCLEQPEKPIGCWLQKQDVPYSINSDLQKHTRTVRKCAYLPPDEGKEDCVFMRLFAVKSSQCYCNETACNHAKSNTANVLSMLISLFATFFIAFLLKN